MVRDDTINYVTKDKTKFISAPPRLCGNLFLNTKKLTRALSAR